MQRAAHRSHDLDLGLAGLLLFVAPLQALQPSFATLRQLFTENLARCRQQYGGSDIRTAQAARDLGQFLGREGQAADARGALAEALRIDENTIGPAAAQTLADVEALAALSDAHAAERLWKRAAENPDPAAAARAFAALGQLRERAGDASGAAGHYRKALALEEKSAGRDSPLLLLRLNALARVVDVSEGLPLVERALQIGREALGTQDPETAILELNLARLLLNLGRGREAAELSGHAAAVLEAVVGADSPRVAVASSIQGSAFQETGDYAGAERMYRKALAIDERAYGAQHPRTLSDARLLAKLLRETGKGREAAVLEKRWLNVVH